MSSLYSKMMMILATILLAVPSWAQVTDCANPSVLTSDGAETYTLGNALGQALHWGVWPGASTSVVVSNEQFAAGAQSFKIIGDNTVQDAVLDLGNHTTGHYRLAWRQFVPTDNQAYFSIMHQNPTASAGYWAFEVTFDGNGTGRVFLSDDDGTIVPFRYPQNAWFNVILYFDLDNDEARIQIVENNLAIWKFSDGFTNGSAQFDLNQLASANFYPINDTHVWYLDNLEFWEIPAAGEGQYCYTAVPIEPGTYTVPELACYGAGYDLNSTGLNGASGYWFTYTPTEDGIITVASCGGGADTRGWIFAGECHGLSIVGVNDDMCDTGLGDDYASYREAVVTAGQTYYILWDDIWEDLGFDFTLTFSTDEPTPGDFCQSALPIEPGEHTLEFFTGNAAVGGPRINTFGSSTTPYSNSVWYAFTPETDGLMTITSCEGAVSDTWVFVYTGDCATLSGLSLLANSDDGCGSGGASLIDSFPVTAGTTYLIEWIDRYDEQAFFWELIFSQPTVNVTFQVDMQLATVDPSGVFLAGTFSDFNNLSMADSDGDGIYTTTVAVAQNADLQYKFKNGVDGWEDINTSQGPNCATGDFGNRVLTVADQDLTLDPVCFGYCISCDMVVDVDETTLAQGFQYFPNPVKGALQLRFDLPEALPNVQVRVLNALGATVLSRSLGDVTRQTAELDLHTLPAGVYMLQLSSGTLQLNRKLVVE